MSIKFIKLLVALGAVVFLTSACSFISVNSSRSKIAGKANNDSVFFTINRGNTWRPIDAIPTINGQRLSLNGLNVKVLRADPEDPAAIYLGSWQRGLYYTYHIQQGWQFVSGLPATMINDVQVDPQNKCTIYVALANRVYRSTDCSRTWKQIYFDNDQQATINTIAIDYVNPRNIYLGTSQGNIIKSIDRGVSWRTIHRLPSGIAKLLISPADSSLLFVASVNNKIFRFNSNSNTNLAPSANINQNFLIDNWTDLNTVLADYQLGSHFRNIIVNPQDGTIFLATDNLILRSTDKGISWAKIKLLSTTQNSKIQTFAVNPHNSADLYYVTDYAFFSSHDGGVTWKTQKLPTGRSGAALLIDAQNPNNIYLGTVKLNK